MREERRKKKEWKKERKKERWEPEENVNFMNLIGGRRCKL